MIDTPLWFYLLVFVVVFFIIRHEDKKQKEKIKQALEQGTKKQVEQLEALKNMLGGDESDGRNN